MANKARYDDLHTGTIAYATLVSCIVLVVTILLVRALCVAWVSSEEARKSVDAHYYSSDAEISEQKARVSSYEYQMVEVTPEAGPDGELGEPETVKRIHIPVDRAKEVLANELGQPKA